MKNIAFWSSTPQQGKTTAARFLLNEYGYSCISFADPLKAMIKTLSICAGHSCQEFESYSTEKKELPIPVIEASYRKLARTLGTEWGRELVNSEMWVNIARQKILHSPSSICIDDMRFKNELKLLRDQKFTLVKIVRDIDRQDSHSSDLALKDFDEWDHVILNNRSLQDFYRKIENVI
jgi:hypothetical protein